MLIHHYNPSTGEYLSSSQPDPDPRNDERWLIPSSATVDMPPPRTPTTWPFYSDGAWLLMPDYRGRICYRTDNGEPVEIAIAGKTPSDLGLTTEPRPSPRHAWINGAWTVPPELIEREKHDAAMAEFNRLMGVARSENAGKADAYAAGLLDDEGIYYFKAWSAYQMALVGAIQDDTFPDAVKWPEMPAPYVAPPPPATEKEEQ
ncbi:tail fiber assembly protein [Burkholderia ubonensis]|uniref:Phage tail protein n=1 Tax=Burkholderia ubonensis TaxID=101571 RepID=A0A119MMZ0_9BURK|nr:tail fiber assembly protein [Burkholderia ubonensis]KWD80422.1 phage tail protein [Burkholderia ubonensis]KWD86333.1 phage tail protein [Burkholderia ubonensis]KWE00187.1 phage tail protein [Burkholderia ubonensis]KWE02668.1 phage tail protein [Burkholderia ubonensis]